MFNLAIFLKTIRDSRGLLAAASIGVIGFAILFVWAMLNMGTDFLEIVSRFWFLQRILSALGIDVSGDVSIAVLLSVCFTHAMMLIMCWSVVIAIATRTTVGEIESGTADLLLTLPVSRSEVYISTSLVWVFASILLACCPVIGIWFGLMFFETKEDIAIQQFLAPAANSLVLMWAIGGIASVISCLLNRRSHAIGAVIAIAVSSLVLNFVEPFIEEFKHIKFLGLLNYFKPVEIVRTGEWPLVAIGILIGIAVIGWIAGLFVYCRKDVITA